MNDESSVRMNVHWIWQVIFGFLFLASIMMAALLLAKGHQFAVLFLILCMVVGFLMKMSFSYVVADRESVLVYSPPFGKYSIQWDETRSVETNGIGYVFRGEEKALGFNTSMGSCDAVRLRGFIDEQIESRGIEVRRTRFMPRVKPINTMVIEHGKWGRKANNNLTTCEEEAVTRDRVAINPLTGQPVIKGWFKVKKSQQSDG